MNRDYFAEGGLLARTLPGFAPRPAQHQMADAVAATIADAGQLLIEAGTGTGKTYAYLVPALASGKRVIISTGSRALQEQLYNRDLPRLLAAMAFQEPVALLKGRANYLCRYRLEQLLLETEVQSPEVLVDLARARDFSLQTLSGDVGEIPGLADQAPILPHITSSNDNCLGRDCPRYDDCFLVRARRKAMDARLLVINHHLFFADLVLKETGFAELIPDAEVYVFDEAHQLPDIASGYFGISLSSRPLLELAQEMRLAGRLEARDMAQLGKAADSLAQACLDLRLAFGVEPSRGNLREALARAEAARALLRLKDAMGFCYEVLKLALGRGERLDQCFERLAGHQARLAQVCDVSRTGAAYWFETSRRHISLNLTPLSIAERFGDEVLRADSSWIFTSATLTVDGHFDHFAARMGLTAAATRILESPFDYARQSLLCVPRYLPDTGQPQRGTRLAQLLAPLINRVPGGVFFLCTSYQSMHQVAKTLRPLVGRSLLVQGEDNKQRLLAEFTANGRALLVATASFWEGVDVPGSALSCVIIDKLPFGAPDDPLLKARMEDCRLRGDDPFQQLQLPEAVISLKQGVGRLIRDPRDRGVLILCDPRLVQRAYGATFLGSLPAMPRCRDLARVEAFWPQPSTTTTVTNEAHASDDAHSGH